ncbi:pseudoazurin [Pleomorphomonas diazotrophica]|uniref:Pseudoazurin n=1 Tax=Pleomorphomonas diazotrophica TaxID=1166257 RepID=A0A1I4VLF9_9HYPH|nr:pseudoazurin [Pleomorphomonas diazotrophica]PKR89625.1 pseudoazurin [Pleomorphomonas diazotrophica]SFN02094.1 pseudoazurin [Pleomorphomonas diazotrophica]
MKTLLLAAAALAVAILPATAADVQVKMLNKGAKGMMVFEPDLVKVQPGDTVTFVATDPGHDAQSVPGMLPGGAQPFEGKIGKDLTVTFTQPGVYGVKCKPHYVMGMVAVVVVGDPAPNLEAAKAAKNPGKAGKLFTELLGSL